jgi:hypothetical protein
MSKTILDLTEGDLRRVFSKAGLRAEDIDNAVRDYERYLTSSLTDIGPLSLNEIKALGEEGFLESVIEIIGRDKPFKKLEEIIRDYLRYINYKKEIAETYQETKDWHTVFSTTVYSDVNEAQEAFIDYVEETYQTKVKDAKHLQKLTGINYIGNYNKETKQYEETNTKEEGKLNALRELEGTLIGCRYAKYFRALQKALQEGAKYKDLLQIKPQDYGLPETWNGCLASDQGSSILWAIEDTFLIGEPNTSVRPDLKAIAREIEAPYSVLMDAHKICNGWKLRS